MSGYPFSLNNPIAYQDPLPEACDLLIIGGGVIGVTAAIFAADHGLKVVLCEKGRIAGEQSSRNWGWVRQQGRDLGELPISMEARRHWEAFAAELGGDTLGLRWTGILGAAVTDAELAGYETWLGHAKAFGVDSRMVSSAEMKTLVPGTKANYFGGLLTPSDGRAEPWVAVPALAKLAQKRGVILREGCAVRGLETTAGQVTAVQTEAGVVRAEQVLVAAGAWSRLFLGAHGVSIPQLAVLNSVQLIEPVEGIFAGGMWGPEYCLRTRADGAIVLTPGSEFDSFVGPHAVASVGQYLPVLKQKWRKARLRPMAPRGYPDAWTTPRKWTGTSPFEAMRMLSPAPNEARLAKARAAFQADFPNAGQIRLRATWGGMIDTMPDVVPIVDHVPSLPGVILATGMCGHGFGIGPGFGRILGDMAAGKPAGHDMARFRFARFSDGSSIDMGHGL